MVDANTVTLEQLYEAREKLELYITKVQEARTETITPLKLNEVVLAQEIHEQYKTYIHTARLRYRQYTIKAIIDPNEVVPEFEAQVLAWDESQLDAVYAALTACQAQNYSLECLVNLDFVAGGVTTAINFQLQSALKLRIIDEVDRIVGFAYNGRDENGNALSVDPDDENAKWDAEQVTSNMLFNNVPFKYNREGAGSCAINTTRDNFENNIFPVGAATLNSCNITGLAVPRGVGTEVNYSFLSHVGANTELCVQRTGSATFISEMIFHGGKLPMVSENASSQTCPHQNDTDWLICKPNTTTLNFEATLSWRDHFGLIEYFTGMTEGTVGATTPQALVGTPPPAADGLQSYMYLFRSGENGKWRENLKETGQAYLYSLFREAPLDALETGDYVFHYLGDPSSISSHGFIIVGWGNAVDADLGLNAGQANTEVINLIRPRNPVTSQPLDSVPYIADFVYGYSNGYVGWLQDPRPRPFYASLSELSNSSTQLENIADRLGYAGNIQDYLRRFQSSAYRRFATQPSATNPNGIPTGWLFFHIPSSTYRPFNHLFPAPIEGIC